MADPKWLARHTPENEKEAAVVAHLRGWAHDGMACEICMTSANLEEVIESYNQPSRIDDDLETERKRAVRKQQLLLVGARDALADGRLPVVEEFLGRAINHLTD